MESCSKRLRCVPTVVWPCYGGALLIHILGRGKVKDLETAPAALGCPPLPLSLCGSRRVGQTGWQTSVAREAFSQA